MLVAIICWMIGMVILLGLDVIGRIKLTNNWSFILWPFFAFMFILKHVFIFSILGMAFVWNIIHKIFKKEEK